MDTEFVCEGCKQIARGCFVQVGKNRIVCYECYAKNISPHKRRPKK